MKLGIVGHEAAKFTKAGEARARALIRLLIHERAPEVVVSGRCPLGGIDIWAIEEATALGVPTIEYAPTVHRWEGPGGFKERNLQIAHGSDLVVCLVADRFPPTYRGRRFLYCYHCKSDLHIKSGGCWTALRAPAHAIHVVANAWTPT